MCNICIHKTVCSIFYATGGVKRCEHFKEEVVRCKECKHYVPHAFACKCNNFNGIILTNGFCSFGERKSGK